MNRLLDVLRPRLSSARIVGIGGAVAVGKSTVAAAIADAFELPVISTDAFLLPNEALEHRGLLMRKGFPESYDAEAMDAALAELRLGRAVEIPVYSHAGYDIVADRRDLVDAAGALVLEGVVALQDPARRHLDLAIYVDAPEEVVRAWYIDRFLGFVELGRDDPASFYNGFAAMTPEEVRTFAGSVWDSINQPNLHEHIGPSRQRADVVVVKAPDHSIEDVIIR